MRVFELQLFHRIILIGNDNRDAGFRVRGRGSELNRPPAPIRLPATAPRRGSSVCG